MGQLLKPMTALAVSRLAATAFVGGVPGLQLVVSEGGTKSWRLFYRLPGSTKRRSMTLGRYPSIGLADARRLAGEKLALAADGQDPKLERIVRVEARAKRVADVVPDYLDWCRANNAARTVEVKESAFRTAVLPAIGALPLIDVDRRAVTGLIDRLGDRPGLRRSVYLYLSHFFGWCAERELIGANPIQGLKAPRPVRPRDRVLSDEELRALWQADGTMASLARMALLTAQRKRSLEAMRWDALDLEKATWTIPADDMKSGKLHVVPLSAPALAILRDWPRLSGPYVFGVGSDGRRPFEGSSKGMEGLRRQCGDADFRLHDLRRTAVTLAQRGGCGVDAIKALTQHKTTGVVGIYARHGYEDEKRAVVAAIAAEVLAATQQRESHAVNGASAG